MIDFEITELSAYCILFATAPKTVYKYNYYFYNGSSYLRSLIYVLYNPFNQVFNIEKH